MGIQVLRRAIMSCDRSRLFYFSIKMYVLHLIRVISLRLMGTLSGEATLLFSFSPPCSLRGQFLKERNFCPWSRFFPFIVDPFLKGLVM